MKNKIRMCLITNWYPSKENPIAGCFFKEQAFILKDKIDFYIFHIYIKNAFAKDTITIVNKEKNTIEYTINLNNSIYRRIFNKLLVFFNKDKMIEHCYENRIRKLLSKTKFMRFDISYCVDAQDEAYNAKLFADYYDCPLIVGEHAPVPWPGKCISKSNKESIEKSSIYFAISNDKKRQLMMQGIQLPKTIYLGNFVDESQFKLKKIKDKKEKVILIVAANSFYKNYDMFIDVINNVYDLAKNKFKVIVAGYGSNIGYSKDVELLENKILNSKFRDIVNLIPSIDHSKIHNLYTKADVFVMTSIQEGQPVSALEAACSGLPIYSTRCGGVEDYVSKKIGRIYDINDVKGMSKGLADYIDGKVSYNSGVIREEIVKRFGKEAFVNNFISGVNEAINEYTR